MQLVPSCSHVLAGFPYEVLAAGHYVPGHDRGECARYKGKELWPSVMTITPEACVLYFRRAHNDFNRAVKKTATFKEKALGDSKQCLGLPGFNFVRCSKSESLPEKQPNGCGPPPRIDGRDLPVALHQAALGGHYQHRDHGKGSRDVGQWVSWNSLMAAGKRGGREKPVKPWDGWKRGKNPSWRTGGVSSGIVMGFLKTPSQFIALGRNQSFALTMKYFRIVIANLQT